MNTKRSVWKIAGKRADFFSLAERLNINPVSVRIIRNRDITEFEDYYKFLHPSYEDIPKPELLKDMDKAVQKVIECIRHKKKMRIIGDYDTDGACATWILYSGIKKLTEQVDYYIPNRVKDGYGINMDIISQSKSDGIQLIITCDNGVAALDEMNYASELGLEVIVTDHHQIVKDEEGQECLPNAYAVVNPHRKDCPYPFKNICGGNIAFKLIQRLYESVQKDPEDITELRFFAAIATVGDLMPLLDENRALVKLALSEFEACRNLGLRTLCSKLSIDLSAVKAYDIGFKISPCINAGGRLDTARLVLKLFSAMTDMEADETADELIGLNETRKEMTQEQSLKAYSILEKVSDEKRVIVLYLPECHESIAGIVASRIKDRYYRPTLVVTRGTEGYKGSARSVSGYSMYEEMAKCRDLFTHFGGHKMAAGFSLPEEHLSELEERLNDNCSLSMEDMQEEIILDAELPLEYLSQSLIKELELLEPFGMGNSKPLFGARNLAISSVRMIGKNREYLKLQLRTEKGAKMEALCFDSAEELKTAIVEKCKAESFEEAVLKSSFNNLKLSVIYYPSINSYMGSERVQIMIHRFKLQ